jgi:hypothetical protein
MLPKMISSTSGNPTPQIGPMRSLRMMFFAGLWLPIAQMPSVLRHITAGTRCG